MSKYYKECAFNKLKIETSAISGEGTYATSTIACGEFIKTLSGEPITTGNIDEICKKRGLNIEDPLQIDDATFFILNYESKAINHSCNPNAGIRNKSDLYALRDISVNEEITYDYSTTSLGGPGNSMDMLCNCGAPNCRKNIGDVFTLPDETVEKYIDIRALPDFVLHSVTKVTIDR